jgi:hypothetical protein
MVKFKHSQDEVVKIITQNSCQTQLATDNVAIPERRARDPSVSLKSNKSGWPMLFLEGDQRVRPEEILSWFPGQFFKIFPFDADLPACSSSSALYNLLDLILRSGFRRQQGLDVIFCWQT